MEEETIDSTNAGEVGTLPCPVCGEETQSLKQYRYMNWCVFLVLAEAHQVVIHRACPDCMRRFIAQKCLVNALPANVVWLFGLLPWALVLIAASYRPGHSGAVLAGTSPEMVVEREATRDRDLWRYAIATFGALIFWYPWIGLAASSYAYYLNRRSTDWWNLISKAAIIGSALVHVVLLILFVTGKARC